MPKVLIDGNLVDVPAEALFADDGTTPFGAPAAPATPAAQPALTEEVLQQVAERAAAAVNSELTAVTSRLDELGNTVGSLTAAEQREAARLQEEQQRLEAEQRRQEEEGLSANELVQRARAEWQQSLAQQEQAWNSRFEESEQKRLEAEALAAKEREFNNLRDYTADQVEANKDKIAPQLLQWVGGNTTEEIDASIARAIETTDAIAAEMTEAFGQQVQPGQVQVPVQQQQVQAPVGVSPLAGPPGYDPTGAGQQTLTPEQIANMPMDQYANLRRNLGIGGQSNNRGLFG